jgi:site-specific DNA-methyltransferase (adenine-specific)
MPSFAECELAWSSCSTPAKIIRCRFETNKDHPAQKPLKLFQNILSDYSKEGELILDCFSGSGTTAIACHNLNRNFICIEKDVDYYKASVERLNNAKAQMRLF